PNADQREVVYYDGACPLCHFSVRQMVLADRAGRHFDFAPIGGATWRERINADQREQLPDAVVIQTADGRLLSGAEAVRHSAGKLGGRLAWLSTVMRLT